MEVKDIIQSAAFKSGIVSSFNPEELPGDVLDAGRSVLAEEILPSINCDRTIDITVTSRIYTPTNGRIILTPYTEVRPDFKIVGHVNYTAEQLVTDSIVTAFTELGYTEANWPVNDFGEPFTLAVWSSDTRLVMKTGLDEGEASIVRDVNIDFPPMRIDAIFENDSRIKYQYLYRDEFERAKPLTTIPGVYTTEEFESSIVILLQGSNAPKCIVMPVPLQIVNATEQYAGQLFAPPKFKRFLIDSTAVSLAIIYGMSTLPLMQQAAAASYNLLKKNKPQPLHEADVSQEICDKLRMNLTGRRFYAG